MQIEEEKLMGSFTDPCVIITTTTLVGTICLGVLIVELETRRHSFNAR